jgi:outer membrane immunogenic protein
LTSPSEIPIPTNAMRKLTLTLALFCACCAFAYAGPEPLPSKEIAPAPPPPSSCFEGWYFGIHGGAILSNFDNRAEAAEETFRPRGGSESAFDSTKKDDEWSGEGGLHAGYNWQRGHWVFGLEVDIQGTQLRNTVDADAFMVLPPGTPFVFATEMNAEADVDWYSTGRLRIGYVFADRFMIFGTGGGAVGSTQYNALSTLYGLTPEDNAPEKDFLFARDRKIRGGWTGGGGIDICLSQHWWLDFTYLYVDLGSDSESAALFSESTEGRTFFGDTRARTNFRFHQFQGGLSFHF